MSKILIVDDDEITLDVMAERLQKRGFEVETLQDGRKIFPLLESGRIDLILLDVMMPQISGIDLLEKIRVGHKHIDLPVIMVTAKDSSTDIVKAFRAGANDYLLKPINMDVAVARITAQLTLKMYHTENLSKKEVETVNSMIITYNHQINNPLTVALGAVETLKRGGLSQDEVSALLDKLKGKILNISEIVKKISDLENSRIETEQYTRNEKMVRIK